MKTLVPLLLLAAPALADDRALVIGIDEYSAISDTRSLNGAVVDAERMADFLESDWGFAPDQITTLTNPTSDDILTALINRLVSETVAGDRVVFYFAGLGTTLTDGSGALIARDADSLLGKIPAPVISDMFDLIADREITMILDASFAGDPALIGGTVTRGEPGGQLTTGITGTDALWQAASNGFAWEDVDRGVFTYNFIDGIRSGIADGDQDGKITNAELLTHLETRMATWCDTARPCDSTSPGFTGDVTAVIGQGVAPAIVAEPLPIAPILPGDDAPASYVETLGFVTDLFSPSNDAGLTLAMEGTPQVGETVAFSVTAQRPGTLVLLDVDPMGNLAQVFPSTLAPTGSTQISPDTPLMIPNGTGPNGQPIRLRVTEPTGQGFLLGLFVEGDLPQLTALLPANIGGGPVPNAGQYLYEISQELLALQADASDPVRWSATYLPYHIEP